MSRNNFDFFKEKREWSEIKDSLLGYYLKPYFQKIIFTRRPILYIDCFAGKGLFDDGKAGSPIIALDIIRECLQNTNVDNPKINCNFIELNHSDELKMNLKDYININIIKGKYEENIENIVKDKDMYNVFMYIDPYGIKALQFSIFQKLALMNLNSLELLINMNSFGFIREACHALNINYDIDVSDEIIEYEPTILSPSLKSIQDLNEIAGGDYWKGIINDYKLYKIDGYEAEKRFSEMYCNRLKQVFSFVLNMPIRLKRGQRPKYRMIHATNHKDGCILMNDNICKRWEALQEKQNGGQISLFIEDIENNAFDENEIRRDLLNFIKNITEYKELNIFLAEFLSSFVVRCCTSDIKNQLKLLEKDSRIEVLRYPDKTEKGKPSLFWDSKGDKKVFIRGKLSNE